MSVSGTLVHRHGAGLARGGAAAVELRTPGMVQLPRCVVVRGFNGCEILAVERMRPGEVLLVVLSGRGCAMLCFDGEAGSFSYRGFVYGLLDELGHAGTDIVVASAGGWACRADRIHRGLCGSPDVYLGGCNVVRVVVGERTGLAVSAEMCVYRLERAPPLRRVWPSEYASLYSHGRSRRHDWGSRRCFATLRDGVIRFGKVWIDLRGIRHALHIQDSPSLRREFGGQTEPVEAAAARLLDTLVPDRVRVYCENGFHFDPVDPSEGPEEFLVLYEYTFARGRTTAPPRVVRNKTVWDHARGALVHRAKRVKPSPRWTRYWQPYVEVAVGRMLAFCMGTHARLGAGSAARELPVDVAEGICRLAAGE